MLKKSTFKFLKDIAQHNNREWFTDHKDDYENAREDVLAFTQQLIEGISTIDPLVAADTSPKKCVLRIYRDVRFSKNKDPYKLNFGIWITSFSKQEIGPGYYLHLQPGSCFMGAGYWMPSSEHLKAIRQEIDYNGKDLLNIIQAPAFSEKMHFSTTEVLKTTPKGYDADNEMINYLRLKSFEVSMKIGDEEFFKPGIVNKLISSFEIVYPFVAFLRSAISS